MSEKPKEEALSTLEEHIRKLRLLHEEQGLDLTAELKELEEKYTHLRRAADKQLSPWDTARFARHPKRPFTLDYIARLTDDFQELAGDRCFGDDPALVGGLGRIGDQGLVLLGHQKGRTTKENIHRNFGMPKPEGYRKAIRLMELAAKFRLPLVTFVDTPGAFPGLDAEERGQAQAIAECQRVMSRLPVPVVTVVTGEGGSGGALAIAVANRVYMLQHAIYSVISPEGCAAILWKDASKAERAAEALKLTAKDLLGFGIIDGIVEEPVGGAHTDPELTTARVAEQVRAALEELATMGPEALVAQR
ncbi:MAG: acetyl-CoA carboxylase carboxyltransferase subunit alpha, partial [Nitrospirae bacterium]